MPVIDQLRQYGETRRGWLGVRIQQVTDDIAESLSIKPPRGALVAGVDDKGPAKPAGIEPGDVVVKFDGHDVKEMHDLPRIVADTPVGKDVDVVVIRKGKEETHKVKIGRLEDGEKVAAADAGKDARAAAKVGGAEDARARAVRACPTICARSSRSRDNVKGVLVTGVDPSVAIVRRPTSGCRPATSSSRCNIRPSAIRPICRSGSTSSSRRARRSPCCWSPIPTAKRASWR